MLVKIYNRKALDCARIVEEVLEQAEGFKHRIADTRLELGRAIERGDNVLLEGSQGTLLDVDHGTYPYVTSSNPTAGGAAVGAGIGPTAITSVLGILKAYTTRVGSGPFPTELHDEWGEYLRKTGGEVGVTTGRLRRCGWFDAVIARYASRVNGITDFFLTKLDVLSSLEEVPICVAYDVDGERYDEMPPTQTGFHHSTPGLRDACPAGSRTSPDAAASRNCRRTRRPMCGVWRSCPAPGSPPSASVRGGIRRSCCTTCSTSGRPVAPAQQMRRHHGWA